MSDSHDRWDNLNKAVAIANKKKCEVLLFAGDFIAPPGIKIFEKFEGDVKFVWGNNDGEKVGLAKKLDASSKIELCGDIYEGLLDKVRVFMNHYPRIVELAAKSGEFDLCVFGHTHKYYQETLGKCLLLNPGEIQGYATGKSTFIIYDTKNRNPQKILL